MTELHKDKEHTHHDPSLVTIVVDDTKHRVRSGSWIVSALKEAVKVDASYVLAEITPHGLKDLKNDAKIDIREGDRFMSHVHSGASS
jgi:hypothetical protein